jgi:hypothetical protein
MWQAWTAQYNQRTNEHDKELRRVAQPDHFDAL